ncbi:MAG TPA: acetylneuraminate ABC transporter permease [Planctomycetaceae bacterium]|jgi:multiple sugar transport system permease protein|nr:acetylneuraminate ABC transporter permease [Planctomycetaceae bacterium]HCK53465.1 acetylneuraminate ABC transporter permease [Planctomycetaceae bacterium]
MFLLPAGVPFIAFVLWPLIHGVALGFFDVQLGETRFVGLANYRRLLDDETFWAAVQNTCGFVVLVVPTVWMLSLGISALVYPMGSFARSFFRFAFYVPVVAGGVCLAMVWMWIFDQQYGLLNHITGSLLGVQVDWLGRTDTALASLAVVVISWSLGQPIIIFLAALGGIPPELHEAARIDGAGPLRRFWHVTLPLLRPASLFVLVTQTIGVFQVFVVVLLLTVNGGPAHSTRTIVYGMYETAFTPMYDFDYAAAQGSVLLVALGTIAVLQFRLLGRQTRLD